MGTDKELQIKLIPPKRQEAPPPDLKPPVVVYEDRDNNGYFDLMRIDEDGNGEFEREIDLLAEGSKPQADIGPTIGLDAPYEELVKFCKSQ